MCFVVSDSLKLARERAQQVAKESSTKQLAEQSQKAVKDFIEQGQPALKELINQGQGQCRQWPKKMFSCPPATVLFSK
ncbi:hypothetical protein [Helicobacter suis]|uniref:Uncharacterized protein n=1 Tax=Helicobacter suis TaxID=104628 RepID=A0A6J4CYF5_9HELI|nr:hypothetical protein [Helicobacter suis]BCD46046.1 hypothetical protein NHP190020_10850 [Helicobacter suis]BCD48029.1 hypothetical protein NHP194003_12330 [Helicobacter suis]BCD49791.1 hypothetical protein NHP194004_12380 [Helicobacter suis]BCD51004.1 hypothetical protein NHP194022_06750 [Helicobacter suis]BCD69722.1 hypothetical protein SNTW_03670 [Helicobacter suis]